MATSTPSIAKFIGRLIDDTKDLVDELVDKAAEVEQDVKDNMSKAVNRESTDTDEAAELARLRVSVADLAAKLDQLQDVGTGTGTGTARAKA